MVSTPGEELDNYVHKPKVGAMAFVVFKSYDGGKRWERAREYNDFASAAKASLTLGAQHPCIRFRVEAVRTKRRQR